MGRLCRSKDPEMRSHMPVVTFLLLGSSDDLQMQMFIFMFLLITYMLSIIGNLVNLVIITFILLDFHLKTAMQFFLQNFSFLEILFNSTHIPRFLYNISTGDRTITYNACLSQLFFTYVFAGPEFFLLATMYYDHYVAICKPLHYMNIMNDRICKILVFCCWMTTFLINIPTFHLVLDLEFYDSVIDHFLCVMLIHFWRSHGQIHGSLKRWPLLAVFWYLSCLLQVLFCPTYISPEQL